MNRLFSLLALAAGFVLTAGSALAIPAEIPEPATMSLFGVGIAAAYVARRVGRGKNK